MTQTKSLLIACFMGLTSIGCSNEEVDTQIESTSRENQQQLSQEAQNTKAELIKSGFNESEIQVSWSDETFVVGDISYPFNMRTSNENETSEQTPNKNYRTRYGVRLSESRNLSYYIYDQLVPEDYIFPINWAAYYWSKASKNINFTRVYSPVGADLIFGIDRALSGPNKTSKARAMFPNGDGKIGRAIYIFINRKQPTDFQVRMVLMMHEISHTLGYEHSDRNRSSTAVYLGRSTGTSLFHDQNPCSSLMRHKVSECGWTTDPNFPRTNFSKYDKAAINLLYGFDFGNEINNR